MGLVVLALLAASGGPALAYKEVPVTDGGALAGMVRFTGRPSSMEPVPITRDRGECGRRTAPPVLVLGPERSVVGGVILLHGVTEGKKNRLDVVLDSRQCSFIPPVLATMAGARIRVKNSDPVLHSARGLQGRTTVFHVAIPGKEQEVDITRRLRTPGVVRIVADADPHMNAWMVVHDSPYLAVTDERGTFRIEEIPAGSYRVTLWHQGFRRRGTDRQGRPLYEDPHTITKEVTIRPGTTATVAFDLR